MVIYSKRKLFLRAFALSRKPQIRIRNHGIAYQKWSPTLRQMPYHSGELRCNFILLSIQLSYFLSFFKPPKKETKLKSMTKFPTPSPPSYLGCYDRARDWKQRHAQLHFDIELNPQKLQWMSEVFYSVCNFQHVFEVSILFKGS